MKLVVSLYPPPPATPAASPHVFLRWSSWGGGVSSWFHTKQTNNKWRRGGAARDRVVEFGKHKGKMLGMVSSEYLRWMSKNMRAGDYGEWAKLAEQVLEDEVYGDRMEWEQAERLLSGEAMVRWRCGVAGELEEMSKRFGWDNDDKVGWSKVDFRLLGTSKGGRIPRIHGNQCQKEESTFKKPAGKGCSSGGVGREKRRERRRQQLIVSSRQEEEDMDNNGRKEGRNLFPGRQSFVKKVLRGHL